MNTLLYEKFSFGAFTVNAESNLLFYKDQTISVEPKVMALLVYLANRPFKVISRDELVEEVWGGAYISDNAVSRTIAKLRKLIEQDDNKYIKTISKRGYQFESEVVPAETRNSRNLNRVEKPVVEVSPIINGEKEAVKTKILWFSLMFLILVILTLLAFPLLTKKIPSFEVLLDQPLTSLSGEELSPSFSPNNKYVAFAHRNVEKDNWSLLVKELHSQKTYLVAQNVTPNTTVAWSSSGTKILFHRWQDEQCGLFIAQLNFIGQFSTNENQVVRCASDSSKMSLAWDSESEIIYFIEKMKHSMSSKVVSFSLSSKEKKELTRPQESGLGDFKIALSPDKRKIALLRDYYLEKTELFLFDLSSQKETLIKSFSKSVDSIAWSHDGGHIFYKNDFGRISVIPLNTLEEYALISDNSDILSMNASLNGEFLSYSSVQLKSADIWLKPNADSDFTSRESHKVVESSSLDLKPTYSNLSNQFVFVSARTGTPELWLKKAPSETFKLTDFNDRELLSRAVNISWSPDDSKIAFSARGKIYIVDVESRKTENLEILGMRAEAATWSASGNGIYFSSDYSGDWQLWMLNLSTFDIEKITKEGGYYSKEVGGHLYYTLRDRNGLWALSLQDKSLNKIIENIKPLSTNSFQVVKGGIYYLDPIEGAKILRYYDFDKHTTSIISSVGQDHLPHFSINYDESSFLFSVNNISEINLRLIHFKSLGQSASKN